MYILAIDLEATCGGTIARGDMEIIEIGAVLLLDGTVIEEFQRFVRPYRNPILTAFCTELTGITQADVDAAANFHAVTADMAQWLSPHQPLEWCSWGDYDLKQLRMDCARTGAAWPIPAAHFNAKQLFSETFGVKKQGLNEAIVLAGLDWSGRHHRAIDDARNLAKLVALLRPAASES